MAEEESSVANNVKMAASPVRLSVALARFLKAGELEGWMPCDRCGHGALAHGFDEPIQRCLYGDCGGYRRGRAIEIGGIPPRPF
jgi:hypothetical protein